MTVYIVKSFGYCYKIYFVEMCAHAQAIHKMVCHVHEHYLITHANATHTPCTVFSLYLIESLDDTEWNLQFEG